MHESIEIKFCEIIDFFFFCTVKNFNLNPRGQDMKKKLLKRKNSFLNKKITFSRKSTQFLNFKVG